MSEEAKNNFSCYSESMDNQRCLNQCLSCKEKAKPNQINLTMKEQLRTEAENRNVIKEEADKYQDFFNFLSQEHNLTTTISEMDEIVSEAKKFVEKYNTDSGFHVQQSKERDVLIDAKETIEHAIKTIERLLSGKQIKNLDEILADYKRISKSL